jgi:hypothetical protein
MTESLISFYLPAFHDANRKPSIHAFSMSLDFSVHLDFLGPFL